MVVSPPRNLTFLTPGVPAATPSAGIDAAGWGDAVVEADFRASRSAWTPGPLHAPANNTSSRISCVIFGGSCFLVFMQLSSVAARLDGRADEHNAAPRGPGRGNLG